MVVGVETAGVAGVVSAKRVVESALVFASAVVSAAGATGSAEVVLPASTPLLSVLRL